MVQTASRSITLDEFLKLPETEPASEFINGEISQKVMPKGEHSTIQGELLTAINALIKTQRIAWAFPELRCNFGDRSIVPDLAVFTWSNIPTLPDRTIASNFNLPPDWTIEILSSGQSATRFTLNILHCLNHGTQMGWLIDPAERLVMIYQPQQQPLAIDSPETILLVPNFASAVQLSLGQIFDWLKVALP